MVKSHSCSEVNGDISSEVDPMLIKSEETGSTGKYSCRPPSAAQATHCSTVHFLPTAPGSKVLCLHNAFFCSAVHKGVIVRIFIENLCIGTDLKANTCQYDQLYRYAFCFLLLHRPVPLSMSHIATLLCAVISCFSHRLLATVGGCEFVAFSQRWACVCVWVQGRQSNRF